MHKFESAIHSSSSQTSASPSPYLPVPNSMQRSTKAAPASSTPMVPSPSQKPHISRLEKLKLLNETINGYGPGLLNLGAFVVVASLVSLGVVVTLMFVTWLMGQFTYYFFAGNEVSFLSIDRGLSNSCVLGIRRGRGG